MTFEEWFDRYNNDIDGYLDQYLEFLYEEDNLTPERVKDFMKEAWDARYNTLTYHDL